MYTQVKFNKVRCYKKQSILVILFFVCYFGIKKIFYFEEKNGETTEDGPNHKPIII